MIITRRKAYITFLTLFLVFTYFEELYIRPYLFKHHITTLGIADSLPNFLAAVIPIFGYMSLLDINNSRHILKISCSIVAGLIGYEFYQLFMPHMVFDVKDIVASVLGGCFAYFVIYIIRKLIPFHKNRTVTSD